MFIQEQTPTKWLGTFPKEEALGVSQCPLVLPGYELNALGFLIVKAGRSTASSLGEGRDCHKGG
jgi:hypothetical protein